jgi:hypothetical protein
MIEPSTDQQTNEKTSMTFEEFLVRLSSQNGSDKPRQAKNGSYLQMQDFTVEQMEQIIERVKRL